MECSTIEALPWTVVAFVNLPFTATDEPPGPAKALNENARLRIALLIVVVVVDVVEQPAPLNRPPKVKLVILPLTTAKAMIWPCSVFPVHCPSSDAADAAGAVFGGGFRCAKVF